MGQGLDQKTLFVLSRVFSFVNFKSKTSTIQAGTELGQAQLKLGLDFTLIFWRFGSVELVEVFGFVSKIEWIWFGIFG